MSLYMAVIYFAIIIVVVIDTFVDSGFSAINICSSNLLDLIYLLILIPYHVTVSSEGPNLFFLFQIKYKM